MKYNIHNKYLLYAHIFKTNIGFIGIVWQDNKIIKILLPMKRLVELKLYLNKIFNNIIFSTKIPKQILKIKTQIILHLEGNYQKFDLKNLYLDNLSKFAINVYQALCYKTKASHTITYKRLAQLVGKPNSYRAVAQVLKHNPFPIIIPCHRVIGTRNLGGFSAPMGIKTKILLLKIEGAI